MYASCHVCILCGMHVCVYAHCVGRTDDASVSAYVCAVLCVCRMHVLCVCMNAFMRVCVGCTDDASVSPCAVSIEYASLGSGTHYEKVNAWSKGSTRLNWYGAQQGQGAYYGQPAQGAPAVWTTNVPGQPGYQPVNRSVLQ